MFWIPCINILWKNKRLYEFVLNILLDRKLGPTQARHWDRFNIYALTTRSLTLYDLASYYEDDEEDVGCLNWLCPACPSSVLFPALVRLNIEVRMGTILPWMDYVLSDSLQHLHIRVAPQHNVLYDERTSLVSNLSVFLSPYLNVHPISFRLILAEMMRIFSEINLQSSITALVAQLNHLLTVNLKIHIEQATMTH